MKSAIWIEDVVMARQRLTYRERDLNAAIKIAQERGIKIGRIRIDKDGVSIEPARDDAAMVEADADELDRERINQILRENAKKP